MIRSPSAWHSFTRGFGLAFGIALALTAIASGQTGPASGPEVVITTTPTKTQKVSDLTARYRFIERYVGLDEHTGPGAVASYRTGIVEVVKESLETSKAAPKRTETTRTSVFTERPAEINGIGNVTSVTRTYETFSEKPTDPLVTGGKALEGLSMLVRSRLAELPQILCLTDGRRMTEFEYDVAAHQMFIPQISLLVPIQVVRVGDTWKVTRRAAQALLGDPLIVGDGLVGKLVEIRKEVDGPLSVALIEVTGKLPTTLGDSTINALVTFTFHGESSLRALQGKASFPPRPTEDITEGRGSITEIRLGRVISGPLPGTNRLRYQSNREVTMRRRIGIVEGAPPAPILKLMPEPNLQNTWLTHYDANYRYALDHPQDLLFPERNLAVAEPRTSFMTRSSRDGRDLFQVEFVPRTLAPADLKTELAEKYKAIKMEVIKGNEVWLNEEEWDKFKMKVHRIDAEVKLANPKAVATAGAPRIHFDGYLILFGQDSSIIAITSTTKDAVALVRKEFEQILKTIRLNPDKPQL